MKVSLYSYHIPWRRPHSKKGGEQRREGLIIEIEHPDGIGLGEIAPLPGFSRETLKEALEEVRHLHPHFDLKKATLPSVQFGLASALRPFPHTPITLPLAGFERSEGFSHVKWKVGHLSMQEVVELVQKYPDKKLRLDGNRSWSLEQAALLAQKIPLGPLDYFEEPLTHFSDLFPLLQETPLPLALDESLRDSPWDTLPKLKALIIKPTLLGPHFPTHAPYVLSSSFETGIGLLSIARLAPVNPLPLGLDTLRFFPYDLLTSPLLLEKGTLTWNGGGQDPLDRSRLCKIAL